MQKINFEIEILQQTDKYMFVGEVKVVESSKQVVREEYWKFLQKDFELGGYRKGKVPLAVVQKEVDLEWFEERLDDFFKLHYQEQVFQRLRKFPEEQGLSYLGSVLGFTGENLKIAFLLQTCGPIQLPEVIDLSQIELDQKNVEASMPSYERFLQEEKISFWSEYSEYLVSSESAKIGDVLEIEGKVYPQETPGLLIEEFAKDYVLLGNSSLLLVPDQVLIGATPSAKAQTVVFQMPNHYSSDLAGKEMVFEYILSAIESPTVSSLEALFKQKKKVGIYKSMAAFEQDITNQYQTLKRVLETEIMTREVENELLSIVPDFDFDTENMKQGIKDLVNEIKQDNSKNQIKTDYNVLEQELYQEKYREVKLEKLLLYLYHKFNKQIYDTLPESLQDEDSLIKQRASTILEEDEDIDQRQADIQASHEVYVNQTRLWLGLVAMNKEKIVTA